MARILVLGAGFGGLTVATELRAALGEEHDILLLDRREYFLMGLRKPWAMVGMATLKEGRRPLSALAAEGITRVRARVDAIDPAQRRVEAAGTSYEGDYLVVALGADGRPDLVPGFTEHAHNVYHSEAVPDLADDVAGFDGGRVVVAITGVPYKCPPAPYECAMLLDDHLRQRGVRSRTSMTVTTVQPMLLPNAGREGSAWLAQQLQDREIEHQVGRTVERIEPGRVVFSDQVLDAELVVGVPPHRPPEVVRESGLTGDGDWVRVDPATMGTAFEHVFAIGDVTTIGLANGLQLPKAGLFAELEGRRVAAAIAADITGAAAPEAFDGKGYCFMEVGLHAATKIEGEFYATPEPRIVMGEPSAETAEAKRRWEAERLERWFGS